MYTSFHFSEISRGGGRNVKFLAGDNDFGKNNYFSKPTEDSPVVDTINLQSTLNL
jgi:hypothetical protein